MSGQIPDYSQKQPELTGDDLLNRTTVSHGELVESLGDIMLLNDIKESPLFTFPTYALPTLNEKEKEIIREHPAQAVVAGFLAVGALLASPGVDDRGDAIRHASWAGYMTIILGPEMASKILDAHEFEQIYQPYDQQNNATGIVLGQESNLLTLWNRVLQAADSGELVYENSPSKPPSSTDGEQVEVKPRTRKKKKKRRTNQSNEHEGAANSHDAPEPTAPEPTAPEPTAPEPPEKDGFEIEPPDLA